ncbi:MAG: hypothetical protein ABI824_17900 [Acidobacteriota bacterium]
MDLDLIAQQTLDRTWDLHQFLYRSIEKNVATMRDRMKDLPYDPWYFSHSVRYLTCCDLDASHVPNLDFVRQPQALSAIDLTYRGCHIKVWKSTDGELPITGNSTHRQSFIAQPYLQNYFESLPEVEIPMNLAMLWEVDSNLELSSMNLVCPKRFETFFKSGETFFSKAIPHPAIEIKIEADFTSQPLDLDIELDRKKVAGRGERER